jgi:Ca2+-binding RTX toxin-like protein
LALDGNDIVGSTTNGAIFRISVSNVQGSAGNVTLTQYAEIDHVGEGLDGDSTNNDVNLLGLAAGSVKLTASATIVDGDGDSATDSESVDIGGAFKFEDDVPTVVAPDGILENDPGTILNGFIDYNMGADGLGNVNLSSAVTATSNGQAIILSSEGHALSYEVTASNGLQTLTAYYIDGGIRTDVFKLEPSVTGGDGEYRFVLLQSIDQPVPTTEISFEGISAGQKVLELQAGGTLLISAVTAGTLVNANQGYVGIDNNIMNSGESIRYEFGIVTDNAGDLLIENDDRLAVNNLRLKLFDTGSGLDSFTWTAYKWVDVNGTMTLTTVGSGSQSLADGSVASNVIYVDGGYDTVIFTMTGGAFKVGGITYDAVGDAQDVVMNFDYTGSDADGDTFSGSFDVTITSGDGLASSGEIFSGTSGGNHLIGGDGSDNLFGYGGDDVLQGGSGDDFLIGGPGSDTFKYGLADLDGSIDHITDFQVGSGGDAIEFNGVLQGYTPGSDLDGFVKVEVTGVSTATVSVDANGGGDSFTQIATVTYAGDLGADPLQTMIDHDNIKIS